MTLQIDLNIRLVSITEFRNRLTHVLNKATWAAVVSTHNGHFEKEDVEVESNDGVTHGVRHRSNCVRQFLPHRDLILVRGTEY